jgi:hypothetical protein
MTKYPSPKETANPKPEAVTAPCSGLGVSGFFRHWVFRHSSFVKGIAYEAMLEAAGNPRLGNGR